MPKGKGERVMIVDDEASVVDMVAQYLSLEGFQPVKCPAGADVFSKIKSERPDVLLLDLMMPGTDGFSVLESIKKDAMLKNLTVILLTAKTSPQDQLKGWQKGAAFYITKPFDLEELTDSIRMALEERRRQILEERTYDV